MKFPSPIGHRTWLPILAVITFSLLLLLDFILPISITFKPFRLEAFSLHVPFLYWIIIRFLWCHNICYGFCSLKGQYMKCLIFHTMNCCTCFFSSAAHIPLYLYPFLNTTSKSRPFEYLRLTSLGVIGALVKVFLPCSFYCWMQTSTLKKIIWQYTWLMIIWQAILKKIITKILDTKITKYNFLGWVHLYIKEHYLCYIIIVSWIFFFVIHISSILVFLSIVTFFFLSDFYSLGWW